MRTVADTTDTSNRVTSQCGPWAMVPVWVLSVGLSGAELAVYVALRSYADRHGEARPHVRTIATRAGVSERTAARAIATMRDKRLLRTTKVYGHNGATLGCDYHLRDVPPDEADTPPPDEADTPPRRGCQGKGTHQRNTPKEPRGGDVVFDPTSAREDHQDPPPDARSTPPARPTSTVEETQPGPDIPPARCPEHINTPGDVPPCRACADARRAHDAAVKAHERARAARTALIDRDRHTNLQRQMIAAERAAYRPIKGQLRRLVRQHQAAASPQALADTALA
jgi:hypothetical protein